MNKISIRGLDKAVVLAALYNAIVPSKLRLRDRHVMTYDEAREHLVVTKQFHLINGRLLDVDLSLNEIDTTQYNHYHGEGVAEDIISYLYEKIEIDQVISEYPVVLYTNVDDIKT
jgi:hypothetical protein